MEHDQKISQEEARERQGDKCAALGHGEKDLGSQLRILACAMGQ